MWRIGERRLPLGIRVDGGSDWLCLNRAFVEYVVTSQSHWYEDLRRSTHIPYSRLSHPRPGELLENRYHHEDRTSGTHDAPLTLYHSAARLGVRSLAQLTRHTHTHKNDAECGVSLEAVEGLLVQYLVRGVEQTEFHLETWIFPHVKYTLPYEKTTHRLTGLEVGSEYDVKEQMLRDWGSPLGPVSDVTVVTRWTADSGGGGGGGGGTGGGVEVEEEVVLTPQLVLTDPNSSPAAKGEVTLDQTEQVLSYTFDLKKPLLPGSWMVSVVMNGEVIATLPFIIIPLQFVQGHHISLHQARTVHGGPAGPYTEDDLSEVLAMIGLPHHNNNNNNNNDNDNKHINNNNNHHSHNNNNNNNKHINNNNNNNNHLIGSHLSQWIDQLVARFYTIQDTCYVVSASVPECVKVLLDPCDNTPWSTQSPDPKAQLTHVDANNGRIAEPYRIGNKEIL
ncbi:hypothetical protein Pcinc_015239 [Petrolisthes cinctipes]|uniref:Xylosyltransferase C-terminal domain-containing protein n=1 Tax=Petrolisthes cinctipes TaxID=88211 RepID=A0AAE1FTF0_PETCI|nr:hypothetical protein Pcinc_015239 [Petrolisthes cinctipes]